MDVLNVLRCVLLVVIAITGDCAVRLQQDNEVRRALSDNATHAAIGFFTWFNMMAHLGSMTPSMAKVFMQSFLCALLSSAVDVDHFIAARSVHLKDATKLQNRPFLHCTSAPLLVFSLIYISAIYCNNIKLLTFAWILLAAFLSHHIRDAARRGFWFYPLGSTPPLGTGLYLALTASFPILLSLVINLSDGTKLKMRHDRSISIV
ncbi:Transmembrane protein 267 [Frankliniella fusca]|uniref:Transmembrane protein 267 n=1 Tax=Frankliniella fusca TaxID=407009 RepID=A0AAE1LP65_9NEOP|nr:Transmembrane protein 267 [Frankliniella fusca]